MSGAGIIAIFELFGLLSYSLIAKWYVMPRLNTLPRSQALQPLLLFHSFRYIGLSFVGPESVAGVLPESLARDAAFGDLLAAVLALVALAALRLHWPSTIAMVLVWLFNIEGTADLLRAFYGAFTTGAFNTIGGLAYWIVGFYVPALLVTHFLIFKLLLKREHSQS